MTNNILYVEQSILNSTMHASCPYVWTDSDTIKNIAVMFGSGDIPEYLGGEGKDVRIMAYNIVPEYLPFIETLDRCAIDYKIVLKPEEWFVDLEKKLIAGIALDI